MRRVVLLAALALAACGEDSEEPKNENPPAGWVFCNDKDLGIINRDEGIKAITAGKECNAIKGALDIGGVFSVEGLEPIRHVQGNLIISGSLLTDLTPLYDLETVGGLVIIRRNYELDNCFATALANTLTGDYSRVSDNKGDRICLNLPD